MVAGLSGLTADLIPFGYALGQIADLVGLNVVGLQRRGVKRAEMHRLRRAYRALFLGEGVFTDRLDAVAREFTDDPSVDKIIAFIRAGGERALMQPPRRAK
jgi:UDP-N-acetylglucosamine acyltransferase